MKLSANWERLRQGSAGHGSLVECVMWYTSLKTKPDNIRSRVIAFHVWLLISILVRGDSFILMSEKVISD